MVNYFDCCGLLFTPGDLLCLVVLLAILLFLCFAFVALSGGCFGCLCVASFFVICCVLSLVGLVLFGFDWFCGFDGNPVLNR